MTYLDGSIYRGAFKKNRPHGYGEKSWPLTDKKVYKGFWFEGKMEGKGEL